MGKPVPNVPRRCRKVYDEMLRRCLFPLSHPKAWAREIDLINATGQSCAGVKVRELRRLNPPSTTNTLGWIEDWWGSLRYSPPLVITKIRRSPDGKRTWAEHRLSRSWKVV